MEPAKEPTKEDWNSDDPSPSKSVFDISLRLVVNNPRKSTTISGINFQVTFNAFDRSNAGEDTVNFQSVPSNETISFNSTGDFCTPESSIQQSPRETLKKSSRKSVRSATTTGSIHPLEMESHSLKQNQRSIENNANGFSSTEQRNISVNQFQNNPSAESKLNTSVKDIKSQGYSDHKPADSTSSIHSHNTISTERNVALDRISLVSESRINRSSRISENQGSSQFEADNNSPLMFNSPSVYADAPKHVQSNLEKTNEGVKGKEPHDSKQLKAQSKTITKGNQVIAKIRVNKTTNQLTKEVNQIRQVKPIENKITNRNPTNNNEISENNDLTEVSQQFENLLISKKQNTNKNITDVVRPNNANTSPTKIDNVNKQGNHNDLSVCEEKRKESTSYNINTVTELEGSMQQMSVSLPPQSTSKETNINSTDSDKNTLKQKKENLSREKIDKRDNNPIIKKEKIVKEEYNSSRKGASKTPPTNKYKPSPAKRNSKETTKTNKSSKISKKRASRKGTYTSSSSSSSSDETSVTDSYTSSSPSSCSSSDESTSGTSTSTSISSSTSDEDTSGSEMSSSSSSDASDFDSESCSCSDCEEFSRCSCSDCVSDSASSCSCSACCDSESDYSCNCRYYRTMMQRHR